MYVCANIVNEEIHFTVQLCIYQGDSFHCTVVHIPQKKWAFTSGFFNVL